MSAPAKDASWSDNEQMSIYVRTNEVHTLLSGIPIFPSMPIIDFEPVQAGQ